MNFAIIILTVVLVVLIFILYRYFVSTSSTLVSQSSLLNTNIPIQITSNPASTRYSYGLWIYVNSWNNNNYKPIFSHPVDSTNSNLSQICVYLNDTTTTLMCHILLNSSTETHTKINVTENFPLQKWVYFVVSVDNEFVDLYLDGKLVKSIKLPTTPKTSSHSSILLGNMFAAPPGVATATSYTVTSDITIAKFVRWTTPLNPQEVWNTYMKGNGGNIFSNLFSKYGVKVGITSDGITQSEFSLY